ncbi:asb116 [Agrotis segetum nucleopolyhedrovirus B]|uniref:Asb116 n=1 Tax=Agrotis segetum nucleopolyhedrovirus B TaxID=1580580 RepID=A0A0A7KRC5_9ABAC|nr:asb116 [Agrotis segetum nucleopolyhedrovirus B]AIZ48673.1 asb116 [Agrotis segetum nucleopolyhedrovirus B]
MELIIPFLKYSKLYRQTTENEVLRQLIYRKWFTDIKSSSTTTTLSTTTTTIGTTTTTPVLPRCEFCHESATTPPQQQFCEHCLFPLYGFDEELTTYCLLSVCYFESSNHCNGNHEESHRIVYQQRLKMTWYEYERPGKLYEICHRRCFQCHRKTLNVGDEFTYFCDLMFCSNCMFPLFNIKMYQVIN